MLKEIKEGQSAADRQLILSQALSDIFKHFSFVGFYDAKPNEFVNIHIGEFVSNDNIHPCGTIKYGKGQCGQSATDR